jgi:hypothetical protein
VKRNPLASVMSGLVTLLILNVAPVAAQAPLSPIIGIDPLELDFGRCVLIGECRDMTINVFNQKQNPSSVLNVTDVSVFGPAFSIVAGPTPPFQIPGGQLVTFTVRFCPPDSMPQKGLFVVTASNAPNSPLGASLRGIRNAPPICDTGGPYVAVVGSPIHFMGSAIDPDGQVVSFQWDFGDGNTATGEDPIHVYESPGTFTVTLTVADDCGALSTCTTTAQIIGTTPVDPMTWGRIKSRYRR